MSCRKDPMMHKHHIIPRYKGGTDESSNLVEISITQHAMYHYCNYQLWGNPEDYVAWRCLSGQITTADFLYEKSKIANLPENRKKQKKKFKEIKHQQGKKNSQYGKMWITNGTKKGTYRINKNELIPDGFRKGRICFDENGLNRIYIITTPTNEVIKTKYLMNFCVEHNLTHRVMLRAAKKRGKSHKGYTVYFDDV